MPKLVYEMEQYERLLLELGKQQDVGELLRRRAIEILHSAFSETSAGNIQNVGSARFSLQFG